MPREIIRYIFWVRYATGVTNRTIWYIKNNCSNADGGQASLERKYILCSRALNRLLNEVKHYMQWFFKLIKFGIVGFLGLCIDFGITYMLKEKLRVNKYIANTCGFSVAVVNNFCLNKFWTFNNTNTAAWKLQLARFVLFALIGLGINNVLLYFFHEKLNIKFYQAKGFSIVCVFFWNFFTNLLYNFH